MSIGSGNKLVIGQLPVKSTLVAYVLTAMLAPLADGASAAATSSTTLNSDNQLSLVVTGTGADDSAATQKHDYQVKTTNAGTMLSLTPRDVPQSLSVITVQRISDQQLQTVNAVLTNTTGITAEQVDSERSYYFSRGFKLTNFLNDGIPTSLGDAWNYGDSAGDTSMYDRIDVVRGASGLMTGAGSPAAAVNFVRKHADSKTLTGSLDASYGSWNDQRYVGDISGPLNESATIRGRVIGGYQDQDSWLDRYHKTTKFLYAAIDADLSAKTTLSLAYSYQNADTRDPSWGGLPMMYSNGQLTHYDRSLNTAADWSYYHTMAQTLYADLIHSFDNGWSVHITGSHSRNTFSDKLLYIGYSGYPDSETGEGLSGYGSMDKGKREQTAVDAYVNGPFTLFSRQHQLMLGAMYSRQHNATKSQDGVTDTDSYSIPASQIGAFTNLWQGQIAQPDWLGWYQNADDVVRQKSVYSAARFSLADPLALIVGARYTQYSSIGSSGDMAKNNTTPYAGLVYDINQDWSAYASYTSIFQPQTYRDKNGHFLTPVTGKSYETGLKSAWLDGRLTASLAIFRIEQNNVGEELSGVYVNNSSESAYQATKGARSTGAEAELNGALTDNWQMTFGVTRYVARDTDGRYNPDQPQTAVKLYTRYQLAQMPKLTLGGGINWQNRVYQDVTAPDGSTRRIYQSSYPLATVFVKYQIDKNLAVQGNINNLFDRSYYSYMNNYVYGAPRNYSLNLHYQF